MLSLERLRTELTDALPRLHDPTLVPSEFLGKILGADAEAGPAAIQAHILAWIEKLKPDPTTPADGRNRREYELLHNRYVLGLTQEATAERMRIGVRTVQRLQSQAVHALVVRIWQSYQQRRGADSEVNGTSAANSAKVADWETQTRWELASLNATDPDAISDVETVIAEILENETILAHPFGIHVVPGYVQSSLKAAIHPIALRQILITAIRRLAQHIVGESITLYGRSEEGKTRITLTGTVEQKKPLHESTLFRDIITTETVSLDLHRESDMVFLSIWLPSTGAVTVLVVDDNADMVQFYRRCTAGTHYQILHVATARAMFDTLEQIRPDIIVLDVMLPDEDGWHVLMRLHENPNTRPIPVVVVTVVREQELALSLGAASYLTKPVHPRRFVEALDVLAQQG